MGAQHSVLCCSDGGSASAPLTPTVTQRLYGHDALLAAAQRIQCCVRRWLARRHARDVRRRAVALLRARRQTLHEQLTSAVARLGAELQQNADLQALARAQAQAGSAAPPVRQERGRGRRAWERTRALIGRGAARDVSGVWHARGEQAGSPLEEKFLLIQDPSPEPLSHEALRDEMRQLDTPEACFQFAQAAGVAPRALERARAAQHPRTEAISLLVAQLERQPFAATFRGSGLGDGEERFAIRRGRVLRSADGCPPAPLIYFYPL